MKSLIFLVDDDIAFLELIGTFLEQHGYRIEKFNNGSDAIKACEDHLPDLILMDVTMSDLPGYDVCLILKNNEKTRDIPIIIVTGISSNDEESVNNAFSSGAEEYITKPIKWPILHQRIRIFLERKKNLLALQASEQRFRDVTNSTADAIISIDENDDIVFWNDGAINVFGYSSAEIIGKQITDLISPHYKKKQLKIFENFLKTGKVNKHTGIELIGLRNDGGQVPIEISISPWAVDNKTFVSIVIRDITERKAMLDNSDSIDLFDNKIVKQIYSLWRKNDTNDNKDSVSFKNLKTILEMVFLASIQKEENEATKLTVSFIDYKYFHENDIDNTNRVFRFKQPLPFTLDSLVKLAPGFDPETTSFAVTTDRDDPDDLEIWGSIFTSMRGKSRIEPYPFPPEPLDVLTVTSTNPGSLTISCGRYALAIFNSGRFSEISTGKTVDCPLVGSILQGIKQHKEYKTEKEGYSTIYKELLHFLVEETSKRSHGATIIWVPEKYINKSKSSLITKYPLTQEQNIPKSIVDLCNLEKERLALSSATKKACLVENVANGKILGDTINECKKRLIDYITYLSQLARIDGALIISDRLTPISFGTVLSAPNWKHGVYYCRSSNRNNTKQPVNMTKYGTRHSSAVNFVGKYPGVMAFVISQDGPVSCLIKANETSVNWVPEYLSYRKKELYDQEDKC